MSRFLALALVAPALVAAAPPPPVPGGPIGVLQQGRYSCEMPGDAAGPVGYPAKDLDFSIVNGSGYNIKGKRGVYLLTGDIVTMTSGALKGLKFHRVSDRFLRKIESDGHDGELRCVMTVRRMG